MVETRLGEVTFITTGKLDANAQDENGLYPFFTCGEENLTINTPAFDTEAVLLAGNGNFSVKYYKGKFNAYQRTYVIEPNLVDGKWLYYFIMHHIAKITAGSRGSTIKYLRIGDITDCTVNLVSLSHQKRIVAKIEELFSELDNGIAALKTAREKLKLYRQAVLKHAFEGKLTAQWREENKDKLETPEQLLARIQKEREARYQQQLEEWKAAVKAWEENGKEGKKPSRPREPKIPSLPENSGMSLPSIPDSWLWVHPEHLASTKPYSIGIGPFGSNLKVADYREGGVPLIFVRNITQNNFEDNLKYVALEKAEELHAHQVLPLDLVITKMGDPPGDCEIYPENRPVGILTADCLKFRVFSDYADRSFYKHCINSNLIKKQLGLITKGVAQKKISVDRFKTLTLPFPPLEEQKAIAASIDKAFESINHTEQELAKQLAKAEALRQSVLKKAFSGQLVPQDPSDEPASELLARIQVEKAAQQASAKGKKTAAKRGRKAKAAS